MANKLEESYAIQEELAIFFSKKHATLITREQVFDALFLLLADRKELEWAGDLWDVSLEYEEAICLLDDFDFNNLSLKVETSERLLPKDLLLQLKAKVKRKGQIWVIHRYDADPFPSNPHAHDIESNIKLDLSNGNCYRLRKLIYTIKAKDLLAIRKEAEKIYHGKLPQLLLK